MPINVRHLRRQRSKQADRLLHTNLAPWITYFHRVTQYPTNAQSPFCSWANAMQANCCIDWSILRQLTEAVCQTHPGAIAHLYGSHAMTLQLPCSDYDVAVQFKGCSMSQDELIEALRSFSPAAAGWDAIAGSHPKVVGTMGSSPGVWVELSIATQTLRNTQAAHVLVSQIFCAGLPFLRPIVLVLKQFLKACDLDAKHGGLRSYGLALMVAAVLYEAPPAASAEMMLMRFVQHFTQPLGLTRRHAVVVHETIDGARSLRLTQTDRQSVDHAELFVQDPAIVTDANVRNVERACYKWQSVQTAFCYLRRLLFVHTTVRKDLRGAYDIQRMMLEAVCRYHVSRTRSKPSCHINAEL